MKKIILIIIAVMSIVVLVGCSTPEPKDLLENIVENGVIRVGTEGTYAPYTFRDETGKLTGFDVEITEEVAKRLGVKAEFIETKWDGMFAGLDAKRFDLVANQVTIKEDRLEKYDFSDPYIVSRAVLVIHSDNTEIKGVEDLDGKKAGQTLTSNYTQIGESYGAEVIPVDGFNQAIDLLESKRIDFTLNDSLSYLDYKNQKPNSSINAIAELDSKNDIGLMFNKGNNELVEAVNSVLEDMKQDGTYMEISEKWFGADVYK